MNLNKKQKQLIPFVIVCLIMCYTFFSFIFIENFITNYQYIALAFTVINAVLYFRNFEWGVTFTGLLLVLGLFNITVFFPHIKNFSVGFFINLPNKKTEVNTPPIRFEVLLIIILYYLINKDVFISRVQLLYKWITSKKVK
ncbi:hypothetical protein LV89_03932 [Arcicella aurantiaca]|uniref:Uncharacterized protein n=1 Tax=Arcicella aurantiaca TaxID=591202 RepID=A0A316DNS1_9BACT|nr:hypothetical protein LV89_03932 [Arcicella aurantiaca]